MVGTSPVKPNPEPGHHHGPGSAAAASGWQRWLPGIETARRYRLTWLPHDLAAGLVLSAMLVPVGIAYAVASGVPGIHGLYATIHSFYRTLGAGVDAYLAEHSVDWEP